MKTAIMATLIAATLMSASAAEGGKHLFILSGQSNMAGLNPAISFTPAVEEEFGKENAIVVKDAQGGQPIRRWYKEWKPAQGDQPVAKPDLYERLMTKVKAAIEGQTLQSVTFVWMQGERDAREKHGEVYAASFIGVVSQIKEDLARDDVNFVIGRISDFDMKDARYPHWTMVRDAQVKVAEDDARGEWVDTDDLNDKQGQNGVVKHDLHYTKDGYRILGQRFAEKAISLIKKK